jgi:hypothetical protein
VIAIVENLRNKNSSRASQLDKGQLFGLLDTCNLAQYLAAKSWTNLSSIQHRLIDSAGATTVNNATLHLNTRLYPMATR